MYPIGKRLVIVTAVVLFGAAVTTTAFAESPTRHKYGRHAKPAALKLARQTPAVAKLPALDVACEEKANPILDAEPTVACENKLSPAVPAIVFDAPRPGPRISPHLFESVLRL